MIGAPPYPKIENRFRRKEDHTLDLKQVRRPEFRLINNWMVTEKIDGTNIRVSLEPDSVFEETTTYDEIGPSPAAHQREVGWKVRLYGRSNKAQMPDFIQEYLEATFKLEDMERLWQCLRNCEECGGSGYLDTPANNARCPKLEPYPILLYGEAYGARIQKGGGNYRRDGDISFRLFDVLVGERSWLGWDNIVSVADILGIKTVPVLHAIPPYAPYNCMDANAIIALVRRGFHSEVAEDEGTPVLAEGIVARTDPYLFDGQGRRVVWKIKTKEF